MVVTPQSVKRLKEANEGPGITIGSLGEREGSNGDCGNLGINPHPPELTTLVNQRREFPASKKDNQTTEEENNCIGHDLGN